MMKTELMRMKNRISSVCCAAFLICAAAILTGCSTTDDIGRLQWEVNTLKSDLNTIKKSSQSSAQKGEFNTKIDALEQKQGATAKTVSDFFIQLQSHTTELQVLTGRFEEARYFSEKSSAELMESKDMLTAKIKDLELVISDLKKEIAQLKSTPRPVQKKIPDTSKTKFPGSSKGATQALSIPKYSGVKDLYLAGYQLFKNDKISEARNKFTSLLTKYPENEYSDNARFWVGETYYKEKNYEDAILAYQELFDKNPESDKIPGAMLKQALAFYAIKDPKTGKIMMEKLIEKYPRSEPAKLAKRRLTKSSVPSKKK
jgi:tol-pal system protein YbgF